MCPWEGALEHWQVLQKLDAGSVDAAGREPEAGDVLQPTPMTLSGAWTT